MSQDSSTRRSRAEDTQPRREGAGGNPGDTSPPTSTEGLPRPVARRRRAAARDTSLPPAGLPSRIRHRLDRAAAQLRQQYAYRPGSTAAPGERWGWTNERAQGREQAIRSLLGQAAEASSRGSSSSRLADTAERLLAAAEEILGHPPTAAGACAFCHDPLPAGLRPEARYCSKRCRQASSRARLREEPQRLSPSPTTSCAWCSDPMPAGRRLEARYCSKRCRQASSRFALAVKRSGSVEKTPAPARPASATRRRGLAKASDDTSRAMRFAYADPPYPGKAGYYREQQEVDHGELIARLMAEFPDGWALSTSAEALRAVLALCPDDVRVCSWHRHARPTRSRRPISAWEPVIVHRGREFPVETPQLMRDALVYEGRFRTFPGALVGMKPPQFAVWMFAQLGARPGDELVDLFPGSGAVSAAWERYTASRAASVAAV